MLLYDNRMSGNCYKVRLLFAHLGLEYERRELGVFDRSNRPEVLGGRLDQRFHGFRSHLRRSGAEPSITREQVDRNRDFGGGHEVQLSRT